MPSRGAPWSGSGSAMALFRAHPLLEAPWDPSGSTRGLQRRSSSVGIRNSGSALPAPASKPPALSGAQGVRRLGGDARRSSQQAQVVVGAGAALSSGARTGAGAASGRERQPSSLTVGGNAVLARATSSRCRRPAPLPEGAPAPASPQRHDSRGSDSEAGCSGTVQGLTRLSCHLALGLRPRALAGASRRRSDGGTTVARLPDA
mmetsp:Transcript_78901/g.174738  ORF Transcript_78901/g.174738 Transcript_78901/m.174738 type:complete len:204 (+) Transcript_78901:54-665(+)